MLIREDHCLMLARERGLNTGASNSGSPVIPVIVGDSLKELLLSQALLRQGIDALPMVYPVVPDNSARLRFFVNCTHTPEQIRFALDVVVRELEALQKEMTGNSALLLHFGRFCKNPLPLINSSHRSCGVASHWSRSTDFSPSPPTK